MHMSNCTLDISVDMYTDTLAPYIRSCDLMCKLLRKSYLASALIVSIKKEL